MRTNGGKPRVLFLCRENSCRSQMAEGFLRAEAPESYEVYSAGSDPTPVHAKAIEVMREVGVDISAQRSKSVSVFDGWSFDFVITVCGEEGCPVVPGTAHTRLAWSFDDPARISGTDKEVLREFRRVRDEIKRGVQSFVAQYG
jgi:arsenate reductase